MDSDVSINILKQKLKALSRDQASALKYRLVEMGINIEFDVFPLGPVDRNLLLPASYVQHRLWFSNQRDQQGDTTYNLPTAIRLRGKLNTEALEAAYQYIVNRHESLRTVFAVHDGEIIQVIRDDRPNLGVHVVNEASIKQAVKAHAMIRFDLEKGPLIQAELLQISPTDNVLLINLHHIISDGWSQGSLLLPELFAAYQAIQRNAKVDLPPLSIQYADYAYWQKQQDLTTHLAYWKSQLENYNESVLIPTDFPRTGKAGGHIKLLTKRYSLEFSQQLERFSRAHGCTVFMTLLAGYAVVLQRYTDRQDLCIGVTTAGRNMPQLESLIGFFINILPLRLYISENLSVRDLMRVVRQTTLEAFDHQDLPFEHLLNELGSRRDAKAGSPVPLILRHQNFPRIKVDDVLPDELTRITLMDDDDEDEALEMAAKCEIDFAFYGGGDQPLELLAEYDADLFKRESIERLLEHLNHVLQGMMDNSDERLIDLPLFGDYEQQHLLKKNQGQKLDYALHPAYNIVTQFEKHAVITANKIACFARSQTISYGELNARANQLAHYLIELGVTRESVVGVCLERSVETLVALLAIFKAGGAYVPLDMNYPKHYLELMIKDAEPSQIICSNSTKSVLPSTSLVLPNLALLNIDSLFASTQFSEKTKINPGLELLPDQLAYVLYTSGSTGTPKGVEVPHAQVTNCLQNYCAQYPFETDERVAQRTTTAFAVSVKELFAALVSGASVVIIPDEISKDPIQLAAAIDKYKITRLSIVPSHLEALLGSTENVSNLLNGLRYCITAGEPLPKTVATRFKQLLPNTRLLNNYGCTECNDITYQDVFALNGDYQFVPVGVPIANTEIYVLDEQLRPVPVGVPGELYVAGQSMPRGYRGRPDLTAEKFIEHPFSSTPGARLFKTGDRVKRLANGALEYLGRQDFQIKVRGFRIDSRQVEYVMSQYAGVATPIASHWVEGDQLVGYFTQKPNCIIDAIQLKRFLHGQLPGYMVPDVLVMVDSLPRLPSGKVDRRNMPAPTASMLNTNNYVAPETEMEKALALMWAKVLNVPVEKIGRNDIFFNLGGHSLMAVKVLSLLKQEFLRELPIKSMYDLQTLSECALHVTEITNRNELIENSSDSYEYPALPHHYRVFDAAFDRSNQNHYNLSSLLQIKKGFQREAKVAIRALVSSHDSLRSVWVNRNQGWFVKVQPIDSMHEWFEEITIPSMSEGEQYSAIENLCNHYQSSLDVERKTLKIVYIHLSGATRDRILFIFHHLIMDAYSLYIFTEDFVSLFINAVSGKQLILNNRSDSVAMVSHHLVDSAINKYQDKFDYWKSLPWDKLAYPAINRQSWELAYQIEENSKAIASVSLDAHYSNQFLLQVKESAYSEIHYLILVVALAYRKWSNTQHIFFTLVNSGRYYADSNLDLTRTIGWLSQYNPTFMNTDQFSDISRALDSIKFQLDAISDDALSFMYLKHLAKDDDIREQMNKLPPVQFELNYLPKILTTEYVVGNSQERMLDKAQESRGDNDSMMKKDFTPVGVVSFVDGKLNFSWTYSKAMYTEESVKSFADLQIRLLKNILDGKDLVCSYDEIWSGQ